jgi:tripeptide aminopeptidase
MTIITNSFLEELLDFACAIQQIPSPTFSETRRAKFFMQAALSEQLNDVKQDDCGNVWARLPGGNGKPLVLAAHLDNVHPEQLNLDLLRNSDRITGPGIGDNALGIASLLGLVRLLREDKRQLSGDIWLVATVGEEGLGNLRGMQAVVDKLLDRPIAYIAVEGIGLGVIYHRALGVDRYRITYQTSGGHSWVDYGAPSAIHELAGLVTQITKIPLSAKPRVTLNVGIMHGGTTVNSIASKAYLELDLRSEDPIVLEKLATKIINMAHAVRKPGLDVTVESIGKRPAGEIPANHPLVIKAFDCLKELKMRPELDIASTDASYPLSKGFPAICIGITTGGKAHTPAEYIDIQPISIGIQQLYTLVKRLWD